MSSTTFFSLMAIADVFQNSTLMCYITPFSGLVASHVRFMIHLPTGPGLSLDTLTAIKQANLHMSKWSVNPVVWSVNPVVWSVNSRVHGQYTCHSY